MKLTSFTNYGVNENGTFSNRKAGAVVTDGAVHISHKDGGCGQPGCQCSPGHYLSIIAPRTDEGQVTAHRLHFESQKEMRNVLVELKTQIDAYLNS